MSILNDLFEQIIQSEERIRERFSKLREGKTYVLKPDKLTLWQDLLFTLVHLDLS